MAVIHVLDKHTAELIAAGEVVERPASVVKELLENAIDAGASQITISIESGGIQLIEVSDNGSGIEAEYISTAFIRHATSKIREAADLESIHTLGFRGEALASIASVSRVEVLTRTEVDEFACCYRIEGGTELGMAPGARGIGTTIRVRDLFYNTPARMKFLKKDSSEGTFVADIVGHLAISHPEVSVKFIREGKLQYTTSGDGKLMSAAYAVLGREFSRDLLTVDCKTGHYHVYGLITPPKSCRASRSMQYFYINGRYVRNRTMMAGMETAYKGTTMQGKFPGGILMLDMPAELVDVNVHPAKTEVRFARENDAFEAVYHAVKSALAQPGSGERLFLFGKREEENDVKEADGAVKQNESTGLPAVVDLKSESTPEPAKPERVSAPKNRSAYIPLQMQTVERDILPSVKQEKTEPTEKLDEAVFLTDAAPWSTHKVRMFSPGAAAAWSRRDESILDIRPETEKEETLEQAAPVAEQPPKKPEAAVEQTALWQESAKPPLRYVGEAFKTYIIAERGNELCLIDKHAAHERILYEQIAKTYGRVDRQVLLTPAIVTLSAEEKQAVLDNVQMLEDIGLEAEDFGGNAVAVRTVPCDVEVRDAAELTVELAAKLAAGARDAISEKTEWVMHSVACRAAIKAGDRTRPEELLHLAEQILSGVVPPFCPHGRPCVLKLTRKELEKQFGRLV